jgi:hypothetical protein
MSITDTRIEIPQHELIWGPTNAGKTYTAEQRLAEELDAGNTEIWVIDLHGALPEWDGKADRYARTFPEAEALLMDAISDDLPEGKRIRSITIEEGTDVLRDGNCAFAADKIVSHGHRYRIKLRLILQAIDDDRAFGRSVLLRKELTSGNVTEVSHNRR